MKKDLNNRGSSRLMLRVRWHLRRLPQKPQGETGFTLVEVIVAIAILSASLGALLAAISQGLRQTSEAERMGEAGLLAQSLLAEAGTSLSLREGENTGQFTNGYAWKLSTRRYGEAAEREAWPVTAYIVSAEVTWNSGRAKRSFELNTLRLGPKEPRR